MQVTIRLATAADDLLCIWREVYAADYVPLLPAGVQLLFEPRGTAYVADVDGVTTGFCYIDTDWLDELWVSKPFQTRGIGSAIVRHAEAIMKSAGVRQASLSVLQQNVRAGNLYRRLGWLESHAFQDVASGIWNLKFVKAL